MIKRRYLLDLWQQTLINLLHVCPGKRPSLRDANATQRENNQESNSHVH
jgi:hypothetical protein